MKRNDDLSGSIEFVGLAEVMQLLGTSGATGELQATFASGASGWVRFGEGEVFDAGYEDEKGVQAFYSLFHEEEGRFSFRTQTRAGHCVIRKNLTGLVMDGLRFADEKRDEEEGKAASADGPVKIRGPLVDYSDVVDEEFFQPEAAIVKQGRFGAWIWVVLDGEVRMDKEIDNRIVPVARMGRGAFVGSAGNFGMQPNPRNATVRAVSEVQLGVLDSQRIAKEYTGFPDLVKALISSRDTFQRKVFDFMAKSAIALPAPTAIPAGMKRISLGNVPDENVDMRVRSGNLQLVYLSGKGQIPIATFGPGSVIQNVLDSQKEAVGRLAFLASPETRVARLESDELEETLMTCSSTFQKLIGFGQVELKALLGVVCDRLWRAEALSAAKTDT